MRSIGLIKNNIREVMPVLEELAVALEGCVERLDEAGVIAESSNNLKESLRLISITHEELVEKERELINFDDSEVQEG